MMFEHNSADVVIQRGGVNRSSWANEVREKLDSDPTLGIAIIDDRLLLRDCFTRSLTGVDPKVRIQTFSTVDALVNADREDMSAVHVILICVTWSRSSADMFFKQISCLKAVYPDVDIVVMSDIQECEDILKLFDCGARGYIPTNVTLELAFEVMKLVSVGGIYIPASVLVWSSQLMNEASQPKKHPSEGAFTSRQLAVIEALRRGKANKTIAYELNMCESTVKVHIRNIMKKLNAKNRTEAAYKLNKSVVQEDAASS